MIYHLTTSHQLPAIDQIDQENIYENIVAVKYLEHLISWVNAEKINDNIEGKFLTVNGKLLSLEMLFQSYLNQLSNELILLEQGATQGYVYTIDPPSIFANFIGDATVLNRLQILAFKMLNCAFKLENIKAIGFNDYLDKEAILYFRKALPEIKITNKNSALTMTKNHALVLHNNSDAFGQNIEFEGPTSMDGIIGNYSDAAVALNRTRKDLLDHTY